MKLVCLDFVDGATVATTPDGTSKYVTWLISNVDATIGMAIFPASDGALTLHDFPQSGGAAVVVSKRAFDALGREFFASRSILHADVAGSADYLIGWPFDIEDFLVVADDRLVEPLTSSPGSDADGKLMRPVDTFAGMKGRYFVTAPTWDRMVAAGLTGLARVGEYDVMEADSL